MTDLRELHEAIEEAQQAIDNHMPDCRTCRAIHLTFAEAYRRCRALRRLIDAETDLGQEHYEATEKKGARCFYCEHPAP